MPTTISASLAILKATLAARPLPALSAAVSITGITAGMLVFALWTVTDGVSPTHGMDGDPDATETRHPTAPRWHQNQPPPPPIGPDTIQSSSATASDVVELQLTIGGLPVDAASGSSIELYLEDDFQVPDAIASNAVYFTVTNPISTNTNNGRPVLAAGAVEINEGNYYGGARYGNGDWSIRVFVPDMSDASDGYDGPRLGQQVNVVFTRDAGIRNPSEEGTHSVGYSVLGPADQPNRGPHVNLGNLSTYAEITLSDPSNIQGRPLTITGTGFNNGTWAAVYLLTRKPAEGSECIDVIQNGVELGGEIVGSDDRVVITVDVTAPPFVRGDQNYLCMVDGEGRISRNVEQYHLQSYIRVEPAEANLGDTVTVFAHDFPNPGTTFTELRIAGVVVWSASIAGEILGENFVDVSADPIDANGSAKVSFKMPGSLYGVTLEGTLRIDAQWGDVSRSGRIYATGNPAQISNIAACSGPDAGEVVVSWDAAPEATHYRIGYVNMVQDYPRAKASVTGEWIEAFVYVDVNALNIPVDQDGRAQYTLRRLAPGDRHAFTVLTSNNVINTIKMVSGSYAWPQNPRWRFLTVADPGTHCEDVAVQPIEPAIP